MNRSQVDADKDAYRDQFDVGASVNRTVIKILASTAVLVGAPLAYVYVTYPLMSPFAFFLLEILLCMIFMGPVSFYLMGRNRHRMHMSNHGYNMEWEPNGRQFFGRETYTLLRADPGMLQAAVIGHNMNPFGTSIRSFQEVEQKQRDDARCEVCSVKPFEGRALDTDGAYFVEQRRRFWVFWIPLPSTIIDWKTYCADHKPEKNQASFD